REAVSGRKTSETVQDMVRARSTDVSRDGQLDNKARTMSWTGSDVFHPDTASLALHDLPSNRKSESGVLAKFVTGRALGVEAVEDCLKIVGRNARSLVLDNDAHEARVSLGMYAHGPPRGTKGDRIVHEIAHHLSQPLVAAD